MSEVQVVRELEDAGGWSFTVRVGRGSEDRLHTLTLSWADHEHWTRGSIPPSTTAEAIVRARATQAPSAREGRWVAVSRRGGPWGAREIEQRTAGQLFRKR